jgi:hypothetical protein
MKEAALSRADPRASSLPTHCAPGSGQVQEGGRWCPALPPSFFLTGDSEPRKDDNQRDSEIPQSSRSKRGRGRGGAPRTAPPTKRELDFGRLRRDRRNHSRFIYRVPAQCRSTPRPLSRTRAPKGSRLGRCSDREVANELPTGLGPRYPQQSVRNAMVKPFLSLRAAATAE